MIHLNYSLFDKGMRIYFLTVLLVLQLLSYAQTERKIYEIQGNSSASSYVGQQLKTSGVVTAVFAASGKIGGFFMQDELGDNDATTSDGIFVATTSTIPVVGSKVQVTGTVAEYNGRTQLSSISAVQVVGTNYTLPIKKVVFPEGISNWETVEGMVLDFDQTLYVSNNYDLRRYGQLSLTPKRNYIPTNQFILDSDKYEALVQENSYKLILDDASTTSYPSPIPFLDANGTRRTGERINNLQAVVDYQTNKYVVYPIQSPVFYGNPRPITHDGIGDYNLKVCGLNVEYYLVDNWGQGYGADDEAQFLRQRTKLLAALLAIDAHIYGLCEVQQGQLALQDIVNGLNELTGSAKYSFINDGGTSTSTYTKVGYIYNNQVVATVGDLRNLNSPSPYNRKKAQAFKLLSNNEKVIISLNHFKAKNCSGATDVNLDMGEGCFNADRVAEANAVLSFLETAKSYYSDNDVLIIGDLNSYAKEMPILKLINAGYTNELLRWQADTAYSYMYNGEAGYLDHALSSPTLTSQVTGATVFHINADELNMFEYQNASTYQANMYRCSDHDPVIVGLRLGNPSSVNNTVHSKWVVSPNPADEFITISNISGETAVTIKDMTGKIVLKKQIYNSQKTIDVRAIPSGIYILYLRGQENGMSKLIIR